MHKTFKTTFLHFNKNWIEKKFQQQSVDTILGNKQHSFYK